MKNNFLIEAIISGLLILLLLLFLNPLSLSMPLAMHKAMVPLLVILFIIFAGVAWKEKAGDEREQFHTFIAARYTYFAAVTVLITGIIIENLQHALDPWLIITLCVMLLAKFAGLVYGHVRH